jgi:hypothetical protein
VVAINEYFSRKKRKYDWQKTKKILK